MRPDIECVRGKTAKRGWDFGASFGVCWLVRGQAFVHLHQKYEVETRVDCLATACYPKTAKTWVLLPQATNQNLVIDNASHGRSEILVS